MAIPHPRLNSISRIRISIVGSVPEIWRLLEVSSSLTLAEVHEVIQIAFGWRHSHLHQFTAADGRRWADDRWIEEDEDGEDERTVTLVEVLDQESDPLAYEYDFGDGWIHQVELIEVVSDATSPRALLIRGERRGRWRTAVGSTGTPRSCGSLHRQRIQNTWTSATGSTARSPRGDRLRPGRPGRRPSEPRARPALEGRPDE